MIYIKKYSNKFQCLWDDFVLKSNCGTIFQKQKFLSYHIERKFKDCSLLFFEKDSLVCVFPAALITDKKKILASSHPGSSYGGFVFNNPSFSLCFSVLSSFENFCSKNNIHGVSFVATPFIYYKQYNNLFEYVLYMLGYENNESYISHVVFLNKKNPLNYFNKRKKRYLQNRFLENKEYNFIKSKQVSSFYKVLLKNKMRFCAKPAHSLKEIRNLISLFPQNIQLWLSFYKKKLVGGILLFVTTPESALVFYNAISYKHKNNQLGAFQVYKTVEYCLSIKINFLDLGVSHLPNSKNPLDPKLDLIDFKEQCGAKGVVRKKYKKIFK